jgi:hypothetical protein
VLGAQLGHVLHRVGVDLERAVRPALALLHVVEGGAVDHDRRGVLLERARQRRGVGHVELVVRQQGELAAPREQQSEV